ncbi:PAS domain S-box protein [Halorubrum sp. PV6]|uniref:PAS domain-containing response regulator n=1 Tax=Halorubrum sp. PV6 TaxID=634157 RepID=UPI000F857197|nr:PAS domain S-box protein [Halorubrum sp. PV6]AZQ14785.1 HTR-like protein [Halorubrum sp. PV6]
MSGPALPLHGKRESGVRILHVDDEPDFLDLVAIYLERIDDAFEVRSETDVDAALDAVESDAIDCIVSDYDMPKTDGLAFLERVRDLDSTVPFILFTGKGSEEIASEAISAGVTDYIQKRAAADQYTVLANRVRNAVDQARSRSALEMSEQRLSRFIEQSPLGTIEYDESFRIVRVNPAAESILGFDEAELIGETWLRFVPEELHRHVAAVERDLLADKGGYRTVNRNVRADGEAIRCRWHNQVVTDGDGEVIRVFSQFEDVTDRLDRKRELERTNAVLAAVFDGLPAGMLVEDADRRVIRVNERLYDLFGIDDDPATATGRDCAQLAVEMSGLFEDPELFVDRIERIVDAGTPVDDERVTLADGQDLFLTYRPVDLSESHGHLWAYREAPEHS